MLLPEKHETEITTVKKENGRSQSDHLSRYEKTVIIFYAFMLVTILICAAWSGILILAGTVEGGGPLDLMMKALPVHLLLR